MDDFMQHTEREDKLPAWAREMIRDLRGRVQESCERITELESRLAIFQGLEQPVRGEHADSDVVLELGDTVDTTEVPLGKGHTVRFADFYHVRHGKHDMTGGAPVLCVYTDQAMQIRTTYDPNEIIIARA